MVFLEDVKKRLTTPGAEAYAEERFRVSRPGYLGAEAPGGPPSTADVTPPTLYDAAAEARRRRRRIVWSIAALVAVVVIAGGTFAGLRWYQIARTVQKSQVKISFDRPERVTSGEDLTITVRLENGSRVSWEHVSLVVKPPKSFAVKQAQPAPLGEPITGAQTREELTWAVGNLPRRASTEYRITGRLLGEEGTTALFAADVTLTPENRPGNTVAKTEVTPVILAAIPIDVTMDVPLRAASGTPIIVKIAYQNRTAGDLQGARLVLDAPPGFALESAEPAVPGRELAWDLPPVPPQGRGEITVRGTISGDPDIAKPFQARVGFVLPDGIFLAQRTIQRSLTIARAALAVTQVMNNERNLLKVNPGAEVAGEVQYTNTGSSGLREIIVKLAFEGTGLNPQSVRVEGGFFDSRRKQITWSAASSETLRALRPGEKGSLKFTFVMAAANALPLTGEADRNFALVSHVVADSPDLPVPPGAPKRVITDRFEILLNTVPSIVLDAFYDDGRAGLPVSQGPLPPQVGQETILTVRARIQNTSNEITDATYRTVLPEGVRWVGKEYHTAPTSTVAYNERTRDVTWTVPLVPARAGLALPAPEFAFQVGITPSLNQVGAEVALTRGHTVEGVDAFTATRVRAEAEAVTTRAVDPRKAEVVR